MGAHDDDAVGHLAIPPKSRFRRPSLEAGPSHCLCIRTMSGSCVCIAAPRNAVWE